MSYDDDAERSHKTGRIAILSILIVVLGGFFLLYKTDSCKSSPANCKEEFFEMQERYQNNHTCTPGAIAEMVSSPPAPRAGIMCHCPANAPAPQPAAKP